MFQTLSSDHKKSLASSQVTDIILNSMLDLCHALKFILEQQYSRIRDSDKNLAQWIRIRVHRFMILPLPQLVLNCFAKAVDF